MIVLDTDTVTLLTSGHVRVVERALAATDVVATTVITRAEILRGRIEFLLKAADGEQVERAQTLLELSEKDLVKLIILPFRSAAAAEFDRLRQHKKLKKIGRADLLIASIALANGATLVTRNLRHFRQVPGLKLDNWAD
jgi:tRNA(fMet)-specific endonuclease VapC